jgi:hypothetical protein
VRAKLRELRERVEAGAPVKDASITMAAWLEDWTTKALPASDRKQATIDLYATIARSHLVPKLGSLPLDRLRPSDVRPWCSSSAARAFLRHPSERSTPCSGPPLTSRSGTG